MNRTPRRSAVFFALVLALHAQLAPADPVFTIRPAVSTNVVGASLQLALYEDGQPAIDPYGFQWRLGSKTLVDNERLSGSQTPVLSITALGLADAGSYILSFTNVIDTNTMRLAATGRVYVVTMPEINGDITSQTLGADVTFSVAATGGLLSYQWTWQGVDIPGATASSLRFTNAYATANGGYYNVRVSNPANPEGITAANSLLFLKPAPEGTYQGIFYSDETVTAESTGFFQAKVSSSNRRFSGKLVIGAQKFPFSGVFQPDHSAEVAVPRKTDAPLTLTMQLLTTNDLPRIVGQVQAADWSSDLGACRLGFSSKRTTSLQGRYTLALQNTSTSPFAPNGDPIATVLINRSGGVTLVGKAADGAKLSQSAGLSLAGDWPLYVSLNQERGRVAGWLRVQKQTSGSIQGGPVAWVKSPGPDPLYPDGFGLALQPLGSTYTKPLTNSILAFTNGIVSIYGGDLFSGNDPAWSFVKLSIVRPAKFKAEESPENVHLTAKLNTGWIEGYFKDMATGRRAPVSGVVLQQQSIARGFFVSTNAGGAFVVTPASR